MRTRSSGPAVEAAEHKAAEPKNLPVSEAERETEAQQPVEPEGEPQTAPQLAPQVVSQVEPQPALEIEETPEVSFETSKAKALEIVVNAEPSSWLAAPPALVKNARAASEYIFSVLALHAESPLDKLLTERFDPEQIWQQIDLQANPTLARIKKLLRRVEKTPVEQLFPLKSAKPKLRSSEGKKRLSHANGDLEEEQGGVFENGGVSGSDSENFEDDGAEAEEGSKSEEEEYSDYDEEDKKVVEDKFLKLTEMEKFLDRADAEDAGIASDGSDADEDEAEANSEDDEDDEEQDLEVDDAFNYSAKLVGNGKEDETWGPKYSEFVGKGKKQKPKPSKKHGSNDEELEDGDELEEEDDEEEEGSEDSDNEPGDMDIDAKLEPMEERKLSAHETRQGKVQKRIEQLEKANLDPKSWTMQGEVTASKRPKNSALEVELDFEHGARPAPTITEEVTQTLEDMIRSRIIEGRYDDPQPKAAPITATPRERVELDEEKSKKGLGEIYEQEYMETTGLAPAATPAIETLKAEATVLFKNLCNRLDALSHFHFAPKPTVEEIGVKVDVPALAMEEVAPLAVSDASMLAPEEVYKSAGIVKGEGELTPEERKRRRAQKKRKRKGAKKAEENVKRARISNAPPKDPLKELNVRHIPNKDKRATSSFGKSAKVFAELDKAKERGNKPAMQDKPDKPSFTPAFLKL